MVWWVLRYLGVNECDDSRHAEGESGIETDVPARRSSCKRVEFKFCSIRLQVSTR